MPSSPPALARARARAPSGPRLLPLLTTLVLPGCGTLDLEARTACMTLPDRLVPGATGAREVTTEVTFDLGSALPLLSEPGVSSRLALRDLSLASAGTPAGLGGVEAIAVSALAPPGAPLPGAEVARYERAAGAEPGLESVTARATGTTDLVPYAADGWLRLRATARGTLPPAPWRATVTACFLLQVDVEYGELLRAAAVAPRPSAAP